MEERTRGDIEVQVRALYAVQPPWQRYRMDHDVLQPDEEVHGRHGNPRRCIDSKDG